MSEYISKEEIIDECRRYGNHEHNVQFKPDVSKDRKHDSEVAMCMCEHFRKFVKELPSADVRPNIHGHWIATPECDTCSECHFKVVAGFNFCPRCGCCMKEGK